VSFAVGLYTYGPLFFASLVRSRNMGWEKRLARDTCLPNPDHLFSRERHGGDS
jgi:hypothetical protein